MKTDAVVERTKDSSGALLGSAGEDVMRTEPMMNTVTDAEQSEGRAHLCRRHRTFAPAWVPAAR